MKLIACIICFLSSVSLFAYDLEVEGIYYNANIEKMELTVTSGDIPYSGTMSIPESVEYKGRTFSIYVFITIEQPKLIRNIRV